MKRIWRRSHGIISGDIYAFCRDIVQKTKDPFIIQKLGRFAAKGAEPSREVNDVVSTAITQLGFIGNAAIAESLSGSDFRFADLKRKPGTTVYICLPLNMLDICDKYFRLIAETASLGPPERRPARHGQERSWSSSMKWRSWGRT